LLVDFLFQLDYLPPMHWCLFFFFWWASLKMVESYAVMQTDHIATGQDTSPTKVPLKDMCTSSLVESFK
jgi:hypothetical protein